MADEKLIQRIKSYLGDNYQESDDELINLYCETYEFYRKMQEELSKNDLMMEYTNKAGATNLTKNPLAIELTKTVKVLNELLKSLGLTRSQRKRVVALDDGDDFDDL